MDYKIIRLRKITGQIEVLTGLHIGASNEKVEIGGMDNPIIRNPLNKEPYIPGSSLKGKIRSLLEWHLGKVSSDSKTTIHSCDDPECQICRVFGAANNSSDRKTANSFRGPTRLIVRDAVLSADAKEKFRQGKPIVEEKSENSIDRKTAKATPRPIERVVPGIMFDFEILYSVIDTGDDGSLDEEFFNSVVLEGMRLLQDNYLGGGGSRGNGRIAFVNLKDEDGKNLDL